MKEIVIACRPGSKWTAPLSVSTPDPCPSNQKMTAIEIDYSLPADSQINFSHSENIEAFAAAFSGVIFCFMAARGIGVLLNLIKSG